MVTGDLRAHYIVPQGFRTSNVSISAAGVAHWRESLSQVTTIFADAKHPAAEPEEKVSLLCS